LNNKKRKQLDGKERTFLFLSIFIGLIFLDQITKFFARNYLTKPIEIINGIVGFTLVKNTGSLFGLLKDSNLYLIWLSIIALGFMIYYYNSFENRTFTKLLVIFIAAGILGNLIDRIVFGAVIDFIDLKFWPVFNIADSLITIGVIGLLIYYLSKK